MALWLIRAGRYGEHEQRFFAHLVCYLTWEGTDDRNLHQAKDYEGIKALLAELYPSEKPKTRINWASQIAPIVFGIQPGDWVVMPHKHKSAIAFGEASRCHEAVTPTTPRRASGPHQHRRSGSDCGPCGRRAR